MKRLLTLTALLLLAAFSWADVYPIGDLGTSSSATYGPFSGFYDFGWTKTIVTAAEMTAAGYDGTDNMVGVGYYVGNTPSNYEMLDLHMFIRHTTLTTYTTTADETGTAMPDSTGFTQVFSGNLTFNGGGWYYIAFNLGNFDWDGTSNIEIFWKNWDGDYVTGYPTWRYSSTSPDYKLVYKQADNTWPTTAGSRSTSRSNLAIVTPQTDPPNPAVLIYPGNGSYSFLDGVLSWSDGGGMPTGYDVYLDTVDGSTLVSDDQTETTYTPTLAAGTTYYWKVVPYNDNGSATGCPVWSFKTPTADQIAESFDATDFPPLGWTTPDGAFTRSTTTPFYGVASAYEYISTGPSILYTPMLAIDANSELDWWMRTSTTSGIGRVQINYSTDGSTWTPVGDEIALPTETTWQNYNVDLSTITSGNYFMAFHVYSSTTSSSSFYIDHVIGPEYAAIAPGPVTLTAPADLATGVSIYPALSWDPGTTGGIPTGFNLYLDTVDGSTLLAGDVTSPFTPATALDYNTTYYWKVVAYNDAGDSVGNDVWSFTTGADPTITTLPHTENFDSVTPPDLPYGWSKIVETTSSYPYVETYASTTYAVSPPNCVRMYNSSDSDADLRLISPPLDMDVNTLRLSFSARGTAGLDLLVGTMPSPGGDFTVYDTFSLTTTHTTYIVDFDTYTGTDQFIAFKHGQTTTYDYVYMDDVLISTIPSGPPEHVTLVSPADNATGVDPANTILEWSPSLTGVIPTLYGIFVGTSPIDPGIEYWGEYYYETTESSLDLSAEDITLGFNNTWYWAILPYNAEYAYPDPSEPEFMVWQFTTAPDPTIVALPYEQYFDDVTAPEMPWGWTGYVNSTSSYAVVVNYSSTTYSVTPPNVIRMYNSSDAAADLRLISPPIDPSIPLNTIRLKFYARGYGTGDNVLIGTVDTPDGSGVFTMIDSLVLNTTQTEYTYSLDDYTGTDQYICFKLGTGETYNYAYIDNLILEEIFTVPMLYVSPSEWNYGDVELSNPSSKAFQLSNLGTSTITIDTGDIYISNDPAGEFAVDATYPISLTYGDPPVEITVTFTPDNLGLRTATLNIDDNLSARTVHTYDLSGTGIPEPAIYPVLTAAVQNINDVVLNWGTLIGEPATPGYLHYDSGTNSTGVGYSVNPNNFDAAIKLPTSVLAGWAGMDITQIRFYAYSADATYSLRIWTGSDDNLAPTGAPVLSQDVTSPTIGAWNVVDLLTPFLITGTQAIWIGYNCDVTITGSAYPIGADAGPSAYGFGNLINNGGWYASSLNRNWNIQAYVDVHSTRAIGQPDWVGIPASSSPGVEGSALAGMEILDPNGQNEAARGLLGYNVFRNSSQINADLVTGNTYTDEDLNAGFYQYTVQAVQYDQTGPMSNIAEALVPGDDLAATAITTTEFYGMVGSPLSLEVTVFNNGVNTQSAYRVKLMSEDGPTELAYQDFTTPIASNTSEVLTVSWTPTTDGVYQVYGEVYFAADQNPDNNACDPLEMYIVPATMNLVEVGDDETTSSSYNLPLSMYYKNSVTEELYFTDEMHLQSGTISAIVYKNTFATDLPNKPVKIWMAHTTAADLTGGWLPSLDYTLVFDGLVDFPSGVNYIVIPLDTPFSYTGGTFATRVNRPMDTAYFSSSDKFFYTLGDTHPDRSRYLRSDSTEYDPLAPSGTGTLLDYAPNTIFMVENAVFQQQAELEGHVYVEGTMTPIEGATVTLSEGVSTTTDATGYYFFGLWETVTVDVTASMMDYYDETVADVDLTVGTTVTQDLYLTPLPDITVSGYVTSNDYPAGLEGATINLYGYHDYTTTSGVGGYFSFADVKGSVDTLAYAWEVEKEGYETVIGSFDAIETNINLGTINLIEFLYTPYNLTATHEGDNARLVWESAGQPDYYFSDFETDDGGWVKSSNWTGTSLPNYPDGDWEWTNTYDVANYDDTGGSTGQLPPATAYSGTGMWGTVINGPYSNCAVSGERSFLRQTFDLSIYDSPVLSVWHYMDGYNTWDYGQILVNGTPVWGTSDLAEFMPWQQIFVDLSAYSSLTEAEISFEWSSTTVSNYAGWYIDDIYIGPATARNMVAQTFGTRDAHRWFLDYDVFRLLPGEEEIPGNWTLLQAAYEDTTYLDTGFATLPDGAYKWAVQANYSGDLASDAIFSNVLGVLNTPQDIAIALVGADISLSWTAQPGATYYAVYAATDPYGTYTLLGYTDTASYTIVAPAEPFEFFKVTANDGVMPVAKGMMLKSSK